MLPKCCALEMNKQNLFIHFQFNSSTDLARLISSGAISRLRLLPNQSSSDDV